MGPLEQFLWGFIGSLATEIPYLSRVSRAGRPFPKRFGRKSYWLIRLFVAAVSGAVAVAAQAQGPLAAMHLGAATPLLLDHWQNKLPPGTEG